ncbi:MAG: FHA domain-containing protein [Cytophagales bacterium]|nr:FHA domain-containing protein [Bernardetiaceae bacterium]MDW8210427.1 FHA domain-containing protein [Cytophagales bacterium]
MNIIVTECTNCKLKIKFDEDKVNPTTPLVRCPACRAINNIAAQLKQKEDWQQSLQEQTLVEQPPTEEVGWIVVHDENTPVQTLPLKMGKNVIGRAARSKLADVPIVTEDRYMSRNHCTIEVIRRANGQLQYVIYDNGSTNGTYINAVKSSRLKPNMQVILHDGDTIQIGRTKVVLKTKECAANAAQATSTVVMSSYMPTIIM